MTQEHATLTTEKTDLTMSFKPLPRHLLLPLLLLAASCGSDFEEPFPDRLPSREEPELIPGVISLKLDRATAEALCVTRTRSGELQTGNLSFDELCRRYRVTSLERLFNDYGCAERTRKAGLDLWYVVRFEGDSERIVADFGRTEGVIHAEPVGRVSRTDTWTVVQPDPDRHEAAAGERTDNAPFDDPLFRRQWALRNDGTTHTQAVAGADIDILPAWEQSTGSSDVIVAVMDEGVQYNHPDLEANMWSGIGRNFCLGANPDRISWGAHGTHVAGTIAAVNNNGIGICGTAGGSGRGDGARIMTCEIFHPSDRQQNATFYGIADAIKYSADNGAVISQNSWNLDGSWSAVLWKERFQVLIDAIDYFIRYAGMSPDGETQVGPMAGGVVIFAAGNDYAAGGYYPASHEPCICVGAMTCTFMPATYTNYGSNVDIAAPGGGPWSYGGFTDASQCDILSTYPTDMGDCYTPGYAYMQGTSMACPHVSGIAALIVSRFGGPGFTNEQLKDILFHSTRDITAYYGTGSDRRPIGPLIDAGMALAPDNRPPVLTPAPDQEERFTLHPGQSRTLRYRLEHYTEWELTDPSRQIETSLADNELTLRIDASRYAVTGPYVAELVLTNDISRVSRRIEYRIEEEAPLVRLDLYPNPCADHLYILAQDSGEATVRLRNSIGREVFRRTIPLKEETPYLLDLSELSAGTYRLETDLAGQTVTRTVVKR